MSRLRSCHFSGEGSLSIWFCGNNMIKIVNLNDFSVAHTAKIFPEFDEASVSIPTRCVSKDSCELIICVFMVDGMYNICNYMRGEKPDYYASKDLFPECKKEFKKKKKNFILFFFQILIDFKKLKNYIVLKPA